MNKILTLCCFLFLIISCTSKKNDKKEVRVQLIESPTEGISAQPFLFSGESTLLSWIENKNDSLYTLKYSELKNEQWASAKTIASGSDWFVNWADFPAIAEQNGTVLSHFLQMSAEGTYTYDIRMKLFNDNTNIEQDNFLMHKDSTKSEHGFVTLLPYKNEGFFVTWLDGRNTTGDHDHGGAGAMTLRAAELKLTGEIVNETELDARTCDCCQTTAAITKNGPIVIYRDRSDAEIRDIYITRKTNSIWSQPKAIYNDNWKISGCPVNGPKAVAKGNLLAVAWYTAADEMPKVKLIFSKDGGKTFDKPILIDELNTVGRVDVAMVDQESVLVSWVTSEGSKTIIKAVKVNTSGNKNNPVVIAELDPSRASGFPQLEIVGDKALFAWTAILNDKTTVKTAKVLLTDF